MDFKENRPIYKQIVEHFYNQILNEEWETDCRVPSVRELAVMLEVNPNTAIRAFHELQQEGILFNKRGIGYFVEEEALEKVKQIKREEFIKEKLPSLINSMEQLGISFEELRELYKNHHKKNTA